MERPRLPMRTLLLSLALLAGTAHAQTVYYVRTDGNDMNSGRSWAEAVSHPMALINMLAAGDQIWVAEGTYVVQQLPLYAVTGLYGGFAGTEASLQERDFRAHPTIFDGQYVGPIVMAVGGDLTQSRIDGITFTHGTSTYGGGILIGGPGAISNCRFVENHAVRDGTDWGVGGAIGVFGQQEPVVITSCSFERNWAEAYASDIMSQNASVQISNSIFTGTQGVISTVMIGGFDTQTVTGCTFTAPASSEAYCIYAVGACAPVMLSVTNSIVWGFNSTPIAAYPDGGCEPLPQIVIHSNILVGGYPGENNLALDPLFVDAAHADYRLSRGSPAIALGDPASVPADILDLDFDHNVIEPIPFDVLGGLRWVDARPDAGAMEVQTPGACPPVILQAPTPVDALGGAPAQLGAIIDGRDPEFRWYRGNTPLADDTRVHGTATQQLRIDALGAEDDAIYSLHVHTSCGDIATPGVRVRVRIPCAPTTGFSIAMNGTGYVVSQLDVSETAYAVALWFRSAGPEGGLFMANYTDSGHDRHIYLHNGDLFARVWSDEVINTSGLHLNDGAWHHVVHTFGSPVDGGAPLGQRLYVDGVERAAGVKDRSDFDWQDAIAIGASYDSTILPGEVDEVVIWNVALRADQAALAYSNIQSPPLPERIQARWRFDEGTGGVAHDSIHQFLAYLNGCTWNAVRVCCAGDFNDDGTLNSQDFFDFLGAFFTLAPEADFNADSVINSQDFFDFLVVFFAGCP